MNHTCICLPAEAGTHLPTPNGWKAELAWATRTVSKQSAQDCYTMFIAAANRSKHHASLGKMMIHAAAAADDDDDDDTHVDVDDAHLNCCCNWCRKTESVD